MFRDLNHHCKKKLIFQLFGNQINNFSYLFEDIDANYQASETFIYGVIKNMRFELYDPDEVILSYGESFKSIYFIINGGV